MIFNYSLTDEGVSFNFKPGYKLNLEKRLVIKDDNAYALIDEMGKNIDFLEYDDMPLRFASDESGMFVYKQGVGYVLEYPDYSKDFFASDGRILSCVDKYGSYVLTYSYNTDGRLSTVTYRQQKTVSILYDGSSRVAKLSYGGESISFEYVDGNIYVHFPSGDVVVLEKSYELSDLYDETLEGTLYFDFRAIAAELDSSNNPVYKKETKISGTRATNTATITKTIYPGAHQIDSVTYAFKDDVSYGESCGTVEITDIRGAKKRVQFIKDKPAYEYEVKEDDVAFWDRGTEYRFSGNVRISATDDLYTYISDNDWQDYSKRTKHLIYPSVNINVNQLPRDAQSLHPSSNAPHRWEISNTGYANEFVTQHYILSGWYKVSTILNSSYFYSITLDIGHVSGYYDYTLVLNAEPHDTWKYFAVSLKLDRPDLFVYQRTGAGATELRDLRLTPIDEIVLETNDNGQEIVTAHVAMNEEGFICKDDPTHAFMPLYLFEFICNNSPLSSFGKTSYSDVLKNVINYAKGVYKNYFFLGNGTDAAPKATNEIVSAIYHGLDDNQSNDVTFGLNRLYPAKRRYVRNVGYVTTYVVDDDVSGFLIVKEVDEAGTLISMTKYNELLDVIYSAKDGITQTIQKDDLGRTTGESVTDTTGNVLYVRNTRYDTVSGNPTIVLTDEFGESTTTTLDETWGNVISTELADGTILTDEYDSSMSIVTKKNFGVNNGRSIELGYPNAFSTTVQTGDLDYKFNYQALNVTDSNGTTRKTERTTVIGQGTSIAVYDITPFTQTSHFPSASSPTYAITTNLDKYGRIATVNGLIENEYDIIPFFDSDTGERTVYADNADALIATSTDLIMSTKARYEYDIRNRLSKKSVTGKTSYSSKRSDEAFEYDGKNRLTAYTATVYSGTVPQIMRSEITYATQDTSLDADDRISEYAYYFKPSPDAEAGNLIFTSSNTYDSFRRISQKTVNFESTPFTKTIEYDHTRINKLTASVGSFGIIEYVPVYDALGKYHLRRKQREVFLHLPAMSTILMVNL